MRKWVYYWRMITADKRKRSASSPYEIFCHIADTVVGFVIITWVIKYTDGSLSHNQVVLVHSQNNNLRKHTATPF